MLTNRINTFPAGGVHPDVATQCISGVFADGGLLFRAALDSPLATLAHAQVVALEVDEVKGVFDWHGVVVHGRPSILHESGTPAEVEAFHDAETALNQFLPESASTTAAAGAVIVRVEPDEITCKRPAA